MKFEISDCRFHIADLRAQREEFKVFNFTLSHSSILILHSEICNQLCNRPLYRPRHNINTARITK